MRYRTSVCPSNPAGELLIGEGAGRDAAVSCTMDARLGGEKDTGICRRCGITVGYRVRGLASVLMPKISASLWVPRF